MPFFILLLFLLFPVQSCASTMQTHCLAVALFYEASLESMKGKRAVLDVLQTRMSKQRKTACAVLKQKGQFSFKPRTWKATTKQLTTYEEVRKMKPVVKGYTHFTHKSVKRRWQKKASKAVVIGKHKFFLIKEE